MSKRTDDIKAALRKKKKDKEKPTLTRKNLLSSGSTLLNLACSNNPWGAFLKGHYYLLVGDSKAGKTWISMSCFAEAAHNKHFDDYRLIFDNPEDGALFDIAKFFGKATAKRVEAPAYSGKIERGKVALCSKSIEEFYYYIDDAIQDGRPFIYVLDSMDSVGSEDDEKKWKKTKKAYRADKEIEGSYGTSKAKKNSENLHRLMTPLKESGSILLIVNQTRDNLGFGHTKTTRSGGRALFFYSSVCTWSSVKESIRKTVRGKPRKIGSIVKIKIEKNRLTGREPTVEIPIYPNHGIDDVGSCVDYLISEGVFTKSGTKIKAEMFEFKGSASKLIRKIEEENLEKDLRKLTGITWNEIIEASGVKRKRRYE